MRDSERMGGYLEANSTSQRTFMECAQIYDEAALLHDTLAQSALNALERRIAETARDDFRHRADECRSKLS